MSYFKVNNVEWEFVKNPYKVKKIEYLFKNLKDKKYLEWYVVAESYYGIGDVLISDTPNGYPKYQLLHDDIKDIIPVKQTKTMSKLRDLKESYEVLFEAAISDLNNQQLDTIFEDWQSRHLAKKLEKNNFKDSKNLTAEQKRERVVTQLNKSLESQYNVLRDIMSHSTNYVKSILASVGMNLVGICLLIVGGIGFTGARVYRDKEKFEFLLDKANKNSVIVNKAREIDRLVNSQHYVGREDDIKKIYKSLREDIKKNVPLWKKEYREIKSGKQEKKVSTSSTPLDNKNLKTPSSINKQSKTISINPLGSLEVDSELELINKWKPLIERSSQRIINNFLGNMLYTVYDDHDNRFWDRYTGVNTDIERRAITRSIKSDVPRYMSSNNMNISDLFRKYLPKFNLQRLLNSIELEYIELSDDSFSVQLSDNLSSMGEFFCGAMIEFDKNLNSYGFDNF